MFRAMCGGIALGGAVWVYVRLRRRKRAIRGGAARLCAPCDGTCDQESSTVTYGHTRDPAALHKRLTYIPWDDYFMAVAVLSSYRSKDPSRQVGACIVDTSTQRIVGIGYNGFPLGCSDDALPWARSAPSELDTKYPYVCHAEMNAIMNKNSESLEGCRIYVTLFPCNECAKLIVQSRIAEVVYFSDKCAMARRCVGTTRACNRAHLNLLTRLVPFSPRPPQISRLGDDGRVEEDYAARGRTILGTSTSIACRDRLWSDGLLRIQCGKLNGHWRCEAVMETTVCSRVAYCNTKTRCPHCPGLS